MMAAALFQERLAQRLAITDDLTGIYNGRYFRHFLARIIEKARTLRFPVTLLLFDIDNFKSYNDRYGHGVGDEILRQTAALMRRCCRPHDLVARISGDEFAVVFWEKEGPRQRFDKVATETPVESTRDPVAISGTQRIFPGRSRWPHPTRVLVRVGEPFSLPHVPDGRLDRAALADGTERIMSTIEALLPPAQRRLPSVASARPEDAAQTVS